MGEKKLENFEWLLEPQYLDEIYNVTLRWALYSDPEVVTQPANFYDEAITWLDPSPDDVILDVGCHTGVLLERSLDGRPLPKVVVGVDISEKAIHGFTSDKERVQLVVGDMRQLPLPDDSVDSTLALFSVYHSGDYNEFFKTIRELWRVTKPGGKLAIATSGKKNKYFHRILERDIAEELSRLTGTEVKPPPRFAIPFDTDIAENFLPEFFEIEDCFEQICEMQIRSQYGYDLYRGSIRSMVGSFQPLPTQENWQRAFRSVVPPAINMQIRSPQGYFKDYVDRRMYFCRNIKGK